MRPEPPEHNQEKLNPTLNLWNCVFGDGRGLLQIFTGKRTNGNRLEETSYQNFNYPVAAESAARWAMDKSAEGREVYFCAHLLVGPRRIKDNAAEINALWADLDGAEVPNGKLTPSCVVESSPGRHQCYWRLSDPMPPKDAEQLNQRLTLAIGADPSGFDLTQLLRVPGTINQKYENKPVVTLDHRLASICHPPRDLDEILPRIEGLKAEREPKDTEGEPPVELSPEDLKVWRGEKPKTKDTGELDRSASLMKIGRALYDAGANRRVVVEALKERDAALDWHCYTDRRDDREYERIFTKLEEAGRTPEFQIGNSRAGDSSDGSDNQKKKSAPPTHDVLRDRWLQTNPNHTFGLGEWQHYSYGVWSQVSETTVKAQLMETVEAAKPEGVKPTSSLINSVTELARIKRFVPDEKWDANPDVLVCQNGALHIPTRELLAHSPHHYVTSALPYNYDKNAYPAVWHVFLKTTVPAVADFLQEYAGYCLTIGTSHELAVWLAGPPGCGKSTFIAGLEAMLGHRVGVLGLAELERNRFALAKLKGKTLMTATEKPTNYLASEGGILNAIISGESLQVERKYQDPYDLTPHAKILWAMNELPRVADASSGLFRRVRVVKFPRLDEADRNPDIKDCIKREGAGILNWALTGLDRLSKRGGFEVPKAVEDATADFRESNDVPALFVAERCVKDPAESVTGASLYTEYKYWCEDNGHRPQSSTTIAEDWQRLGFRKTRPKGVTHYNGLRVKLPSE